MPNLTQELFLKTVYESAVRSRHIFPGAAAAEAVLESAWGTSGLCRNANNLFGLKKPESWTGEILSIPTREYIKGEWVTVPAEWPVFATYDDCMVARMDTLHRVARYAPVFTCATPEQYIQTVSPLWATDPSRARLVLDIYHQNLSALS